MHRLDVKESEFTKTCTEAFGAPRVEVIPIETDGKNEQHMGVLRAFADKILNDKPLIAKGEEGINGLMLSNSIHLSSWTNRSVTLPINDDEFLSLLNEKRKKSLKKDNVVDVISDTISSYNN